MSKIPVFDIGDTLLPSLKFASNVIQDELRQVNGGKVPRYDPDKFMMYDPEQVRKFLQKHGLEGDPEKLARDSRERYLEGFETLLIENDMFDFLARCSTELGTVGFISDNTLRAKQLLGKKLRKHGVEYNTIVVSEEIGVEKPDPGIFREFVERRDKPAESFVYLGNDARVDSGSERIEMDFIWVKEYDSFGSFSGISIDRLSFENLREAVQKVEEN